MSFRLTREQEEMSVNKEIAVAIGADRGGTAMLFPALDLDAACAALRSGFVVVYPTETFYGLGCDALNPDAVGAVYAVKRRPYGLPLPVIVGEKNQAERVAAYVYPAARRLMERFWPGPLSIIFPASPDVPDLLTAGTGRIAARLSSHPGAAELCRVSGLVLTSSSANVSGRLPAMLAEELDPDLASGVAGLYDAPPSPLGGEPSTIVDVLPGGETGDGILRVLREGAVSVELLRAAGFETVDAPLL